MNFFKKLNLTVVVFCVCCIAFVAFLAYNPSHAYFQVHKDAIGVNTAKVDLLFDKYDESVFTLENNEDSLAEEKRTYKGPELIQSAEWGTEANPYIIRKKNHINNLSMLHKAGYFNDKTGQSFFVVCDLVGKPVAINCSEDAAMEIAPIGTPDNPFTGNINGAYIAGTANYTLKLDDTTSKTYTVSQSTIANLSVVATEETPDVGFFGRLGYVGQKQNEDDGSITIVATTVDGASKGPYSATINNVLFADIAIKNSTKVSDLAAWWGNFTGYDAAYDKCNETHHVGIVAGHVEFATLTNISVYYTPNKAGTQAHVAAFELAGDNSTDKNNYYSITGILGTVVYVNPAIGEGGSLNSAPAISDPQLSEELLSGGGGGTSGMLTGYMLAENIFDRKDDDNTMTVLDAYAEAYDVRDITEDDESIFSVVTMKERYNANQSWTNKDYYYFADTVFTFAMTATGDTTAAGSIDYLIKIWESDSEDAKKILSPSIVITNTQSDWSYLPTGNPAYVHKLELVNGSTVTLSDKSSYVLAYQGEIDGQTVLYTFDMKNESSGYVKILYPYTENGKTYDGNTLYVTDSSSTVCNYSFKYNAYRTASASSNEGKDAHGNRLYRTFTSADDTTTFGVTATAVYPDTHGMTQNYYGNLSTISPGASGALTDLFAGKKDSELTWFAWEIEKTASGSYTVGGSFYHRNGWYPTNGTLPRPSDYGSQNFITVYSTQLVFDTVASRFTIAGSSPVARGYTSRSGNYNLYETHVNGMTLYDIDEDLYGITDDNQDEIDYFPPPSPVIDSSLEGELLLFKVTEYAVEDLTEKNMLPETSNNLSFDASTHVLFTTPVVRNNNEQDTAFNARVAAAQSYELTPIINKQWNDGRGQYLKQLNHTVKMAKPTLQNFNFTMSNTALENWFGEGFMDTNTGGVVLVPLGTTGVNYSMPSGTIAFYVNKASVDDPSEINIIVAVGPNDGNATIGLWGPQTIPSGNQSASSKFTATSPDQAFALPLSEIAASENDAKFTHLKGYYEEDGEDLITGTNGAGYYTHLGGEVAFVGATFEVTEPGVYLLAPATGTMSVAYFSVSGAAGYGGDGTGGSPLGDVDFVYDNNNGTVITVDKKFQEGTHSVPDESLTDTYYPSYYYLRMLPNTEEPKTENGDGIIRNEKVYVRRYTVSTPPTIGTTEADRKRIIQMSCTDTDTHLMGLSAIFQDIDHATIGTSS